MCTIRKLWAFWACFLWVVSFHIESMWCCHGYPQFVAHGFRLVKQLTRTVFEEDVLDFNGLLPANQKRM